MEKPAMKSPAVFLLLLLLASCGGRNAYIEVVKGNYYYGRGMYQASVVSYLKALEEGSHTAWIRYNLANVYHSLGETDAALGMWKEAEAAQDHELLFATSFNRGTLLFELGKYREAYDEFRHALEIDPSRVEAKINLELALRKLGGGGPSSQSHGDQPPKKREDPDRILDYVKKKEATRWKASDRLDLSSEKGDY